MMSNARFSPNYQEIVRLPNVELVQRAKLALDEYIKAIRIGKNVTEKAKIYQAYEDERLKRLSQIKRQRGQHLS
ncbi:MAG: hypothetical protein LCI00_32150 [Chloroflexi bacterium]|nr:hypothetical protein [Chloroflexota bacterium]MCC6894237.1 hypothetical protein [Anaerolineae bacterium]